MGNYSMGVGKGQGGRRIADGGWGMEDGRWTDVQVRSHSPPSINEQWGLPREAKVSPNAPQGGQPHTRLSLLPALNCLLPPGPPLSMLKCSSGHKLQRSRRRLRAWPVSESSLRFRRLNLIAPAGPQSGGFWRGLWSTPSKRENSYSIKFVLLSLLVPFASPCHNPDVAAS